MELGYLNLITSQIDPVHYIKQGDYYYTLTFINSNKVTFLKNNNLALIEHAYGENCDNYTGPFDVVRDNVDGATFDQMQLQVDIFTVDCQLIYDQAQIREFQKLSTGINFNYFPDEYIEDVLLLKYRRIKE